MSHVGLILSAMGIGVAVAAPVGPMSMLCMRRTLVQGWRFGLSTGAGIAAGDAAYALVAGLGLVGLQRFMLAYDRPLNIAAGLFLIYLGLRAILARPADPQATARPASRSSLRAFASALLLTLTNPPTIIMFAAVFTTLAPRDGFDPATASLTVAGVFAGSLLWWCGLTTLIAAFRHAVGAPARRWIDRVAGGVLVAFGVADIRRSV